MEGNDEEYHQQLALLEDERDKELLEVEAGRKFCSPTYSEGISRRKAPRRERISGLHTYPLFPRFRGVDLLGGKREVKDDLLNTLNGRLIRLQADTLLLNQANDATSLTTHAFAAYPPLTIPDPTLSSSRNLRTPGSKRSARNRDDDERVQSQKPVKRGRREDYEIYGEGGMWEKEKATKVFGPSDDWELWIWQALGNYGNYSNMMN